MRNPIAPLSVFAILASLLAAPALAAPSIEPGLWEVQSDTQAPGQTGKGAQPDKAQEQMKSLPPELRKMMEQQLAKSGVGVTKKGVRMCITPEQARGDQPPKFDQSGNCTYSQAKLSGNSWRGELVCTQPPGKGSFETVVHSRKHFTTQGTMQTQQGVAQTRHESRWLQADCGALKPAR